MTEKICIAISACLLGQRVRYDGQSKRDPMLCGLGRRVTWIPVCPEKECGLSVPREPMRLCKSPVGVRLVTASGTDVTPMLRAWAGKKLEKLPARNISGYVFKAGSPSCALYSKSGRKPRARKGAGLWADMFIRRFPNVPVEQDDRLGDRARFNDFMDRVLSYARLSGTGRRLRKKP
jgi:uncharacterized protein YbbK (DUF523 family)